MNNLLELQTKALNEINEAFGLEPVFTRSFNCENCGNCDRECDNCEICRTA